MESILALDHGLFLFINHLPHTPLLDWFALWLSGIGMFGLVWLLMSVWLFIREERRDHWFFLPIISASALSDLVTNVLLKNFFLRNRPPASLGTVFVEGTLSDHSFPSGHATFAWALAVVLAAKEPRAKYFFYLLAFLISVSRIYLGVHYPADVVAGTLIGISIGLFSLWLERPVIQYRHDKTKRKRAPHRGR